VQHDVLRVLGAGENVQLVAPGVAWTIIDDGPHQRAVAFVDLKPEQPLVCEMQAGADASAAWRATEIERRRSTIEYWSAWASTLRLPPVARRMVSRSALTLKALCYQPTGAILAAATTSLPEEMRGSRNWDYRYCWVRDAAVAAHALLSVGSAREALAYLDWLIERVAHVPSAERLRPLYPLVGDEFLPEAVIPTLNGYRGSRPVRIGNLAEHQLQLDMFGPVVDLVHRLGGAGVFLTDRHWELTRAMVDAVCHRWREPDHGIWEERRAPRHFVVSKLMCWMAVDRGIAIASGTGRPVPSEWVEARSEIKDDVLRDGWNPEIGSFSASYGDSDVDAGILQVALTGMLPPDDPRVIGTVLRVERVLREGEVVFRYRHDDGLPGSEGGFLLCTAWLIEAFVAIGRVEDARELFDRYLDLAGPTGLLSEEWDPIRETALGNFPQAYSHAGLINAAVALARARTIQQS
jgi:GH15 family glucan-1,4-alpha-glucosidase